MKDDAAFHDDLDQDPLETKIAGSIMGELRGTVPSLAEETAHERWTTNPLQLIQFSMSSSTLQQHSFDDDVPS